MLFSILWFLKTVNQLEDALDNTVRLKSPNLTVLRRKLNKKFIEFVVLTLIMTPTVESSIYTASIAGGAITVTSLASLLTVALTKMTLD
jgi:hypothetical protein